jgi:hypothetical protein
LRYKISAKIPKANIGKITDISGVIAPLKANLPSTKSIPQRAIAIKINMKFIRARLKNLPDNGR